MISLFMCFLTSIGVLSLCILLVPGIELENISDFAFSAFVLSLMNFVLTPLLLRLNLRIKVSSLGIFSFIVNFLFLNIAHGIIDDFSLNTIEGALFGAGLLAFFQVALDYADPDRRTLITTP